MGWNVEEGTGASCMRERKRAAVREKKLSTVGQGRVSEDDEAWTWPREKRDVRACVWESESEWEWQWDCGSGREHLESLEIPTVSGGYYRLSILAPEKRNSGRRQTSSTEGPDTLDNRRCKTTTTTTTPSAPSR